MVTWEELGYDKDTIEITANIVLSPGGKYFMLTVDEDGTFVGEEITDAE